MYRLFRFALFLCLLTMLAACAVSATPQPTLLQSSVERTTPALSIEALQSQGAANNAFALEFYTTARSEQKGNFVFSPYSIRTAFGMVFAGARGTTEAQMADVLHFDLPKAELHPALNGLDLALTIPASPTDTLRPISQMQHGRRKTILFYRSILIS